MIFSLTSVFFKNLDAISDPSCNVAINEGGTSSSKTFSILQLLIHISQTRKTPLLTSVVSETMPHLKLGAERDFFQILGDNFIPACWNATSHVYTFGAAQMEFFSADIPGKVRGPRRDILYLNEANNISKSVRDELSIRTRRFEFIDHNPVAEYWAHDLKKNADVRWIHSTYKDARDVLPQRTIDKIEAKKDLDPNWWNIYGLGLVGNIEGLVHPLFSQCDIFPAECEDIFYGLDFGYTNDPTALTKNTIIGNALYSEELIYESGLKSQPMIERLNAVGVKRGYDEIFADAADPRLIDEISDAGFIIKPAPKGEDSVRFGIDLINNYKQIWIKNSLNGIKEQRNYRYIQDKNGKYINKPIGTWNHLMDSRRYAVVGKLSAPGLPGAFSL
jgi:phage terminase large subunit